MKKILVIVIVLSCLVFTQCASKKAVVMVSEETTQDLSLKIPIMFFEEQLIDIGEMKEGDIKEVVYDFINSGTSDLLIELVTACKCTEIKWPTEPIAPGDRGTIIAKFDSSGMEGPYTKTLDIIANTEPIVVEAKFRVIVKR